MKKLDYDFVLRKIRKNSVNNYKVFSYLNLKLNLSNMKKTKPKKCKKFVKEKERIELYSFALGLIALSLKFGEDYLDTEYQNDCTVYPSLLTNISNDILAISTLIDNGFEFQANILSRNLMELLFTLLVLLINKQKRVEYFNSIRLQNSYSVWQNNIKMSKLNEELANFEKNIFDEDFQDTLKSTRKNLYKYYSSFAHNDFFSVFHGAFSINKEIINDDDNNYAKYNLWGNYNNEGKEILEQVIKLLCMYVTYFKYIVSKPIYFTKANYLCNDASPYWNSGFLILSILQNKILPSTKYLETI